MITQEAFKGPFPVLHWTCRQLGEEAKGGGQVGESREGDENSRLGRGAVV